MEILIVKSISQKNSFIYATEEDEPFYIKNQKNEIARWDFLVGTLKEFKKNSLLTRTWDHRFIFKSNL